MDIEKKEEILKALDVLNKYRNHFYSSSDDKEIRFSNIIDRFLIEFYDEFIEDELVKIVIKKISKQNSIFI